MTDLELSTYKASEDNALLPNGQNGAVHVDHTVEKSDHMNGQSSSNQDRDPEVSFSHGLDLKSQGSSRLFLNSVCYELWFRFIPTSIVQILATKAEPEFW